MPSPIPVQASGRGGASHGRRDVIAQRWLVPAIAIVLVAIATWCLILLTRSVSLRQDLDLRRAWIDDMRRLRQELERPVDELAGQGRWPRFEGLRRSSEQLMRQGPDQPGSSQAAQRLHSSLEHLQVALASHAEGEAMSTDRIWDASFAVLKAASALEDHVQQQVDGLYHRLDRHWRSLNALLFVCLLLCASNLGLLKLAHRRRAQLEAAKDRALELASHDALTGLWNREAILKMLRRELARAARLRAPLGLILADIDGFQRLNGMIGQEQGDVVLQEVSWRLGALVRPYDTLGRFGGDSFLILLPTCDETSTHVVAERLRQSVGEREVEYGMGRLIVGLSLVTTTVRQAADADADLIIHRLEQALAERKEGHGAITMLGSV